MSRRGLEETVRKKDGEREREPNEAKRGSLSSIYTSSCLRLRETGAFPSRPGIEVHEREGDPGGDERRR